MNLLRWVGDCRRRKYSQVILKVKTNLTEECLAVKIFFNSEKFLIPILLFAIIILPGKAQARPGMRPPPPSEFTTQVNGAFIIIINDLVIVDDKGNLITHEVKADSKLNIQAKVAGNIRVGEKGYWYFKRGQTVSFLKSRMFLTNEITVPVTIEVLDDLLDEQEESQILPVLVKGENDKTGKRFDLRVDGGMMAGKLFRPGK